MLKTMRLTIAAAAVAMALPALAVAPRSIDGFEATSGEAGWQLVQPAYSFAGGKIVRIDTAPRTAVADTKAALPPTGFENAGGDTGWAVSQHKYVFAGGRLAMSDECDHAIRTVKGPTPAEMEAARSLSPGG